jgi:peptidoglycan glycosyltransferase
VLAVGAWVLWQVFRGLRLAWALTLPVNHQLALHLVEVGLLAFLGAYLLNAVLGRGGRALLLVRLQEGHEVEIVRPMVVGSDAAADLTVSAAQVSRRHLMMRRTAMGTLEVTDLGSTNGTFHQGRDLRGQGSVMVAAGERLVMGRSGPHLEVVERAVRGRFGWATALVVLLAFLGVGLYLGWQANLDRLPESPLRIGQVAVDFGPFRDALPVVSVGLGTAALILFLAWGSRKQPATATAAFSLCLFLTVGLVLLYPLLPASGLRYGNAAQRAYVATGVGPWESLEIFERSGGAPRTLLSGGIVEVVRVAEDPSSGADEPSDETETTSVGFSDSPLDTQGSETISAEATTEAVTDAQRPELQQPRLEPGPQGPDLGLEGEERDAVIHAYLRGRSALRWATNLAARSDAPFYAATYFRQSFVLMLAFLLCLVIPFYWLDLRRRMARVPTVLARPVSRALIRAADGGASWARILRPVAYWDVLCGFLAALVVAVTLWTPLGTTLGRGKSLYLNLPGLPTIQSVEVVKALFVLFMTGYFARHGGVLAKAPRWRYLVPYLLAALLTLALTGVQADLGGLFMLGLFLTLVFVAATGSLRLVAMVPLVLMPAVLLAWSLGLTSIVETRLGIWLAPRTHFLGEQVVQARQIFLSSGWSGHAPLRALAWRLPDVQGDLVIAAFGERYGALGLLALIAAWFAFGAALLERARKADRAGSILLASVAALVLVQVLTQVGGALGLLPLTGVPLPWISHGLTAALVFTALAALALHVAPEDAPGLADSHVRSLPALPSVGYLKWINGAACVTMALLALWWTEGMLRRDETGPLGHHYRWQDYSRSKPVEGWIQEGLFRPQGASRQVEVNYEAHGRLLAAGGEDPGLGRLIEVAKDLTVVEGKVRPRDYLVMNPNRFSDRRWARGGIFARDGAALALTDGRGRRRYPLGEAAFHPIGYGGGAAQPLGLEAAASDFLRARDLDQELREQAFLLDIHQGPEVVLTLLPELQLLAHEQLSSFTGAAVVLDLEDGAILSLASSPSADVSSALVSDWRRWSDDKALPLRNRAIEEPRGYSPPGSVFKIAVAAALLDGPGALETVRCTGYDRKLRVSCAHGAVHGWVNLERALEVSCNIYFANKAVALGEDALREMAGRLGFNAEQGVDLTRGLPGVEMRTGVSTVLSGTSPLRDRDLARVGYGQGPVSATPFDIARLGLVIATGGWRQEPYLVRSYGFSKETEEGFRDHSSHRMLPAGKPMEVLAPRVARKINEMLRKVFSGQRGTARGLPKLWHGPEGYELGVKQPGGDVDLVTVAGKTGSAWRTRNDTLDDAWMLAWAPVEEPRVLVSVMLADAGEGGKVAGPIAMELLRQALDELEDLE